jgi:glutathione S-transferase
VEQNIDTERRANMLKVYGFHLSQPSRAVYMMLDDANIPFERINIDLPSKQQKSAEYLAINPAGVVPTIDDDGFRLGEGAAILQYLAESRQLDNLYPRDAKQRALINYWLHWSHNSARHATFDIFRACIFNRPVVKATFATAIEFLDAHLASNKFLASTEHMTIADYFILPELDQLEWLGSEVFDFSAYPNVTRFMATCKSAVSCYAKYTDNAQAMATAAVNRHRLSTRPIKVYGFPGSQPTRSVLMLLDAAMIPLDFVHVSYAKKEMKQPEFLAINPAGLVPAIDDNGFTLGESSAILIYLCESKRLESWYPSDARVRGRVNYWLHWHHFNTRVSTNKILDPVLDKLPILEADLNSFAASMAVLDNQLASNLFVAGTEHPTIADLLIIPELDQLVWCSGFDYSPYPHVQRYMETCKTSIVSYQARADPARDGIEPK